MMIGDKTHELNAEKTVTVYDSSQVSGVSGSHCSCFRITRSLAHNQTPPCVVGSTNVLSSKD